MATSLRLVILALSALSLLLGQSSAVRSRRHNPWGSSIRLPEVVLQDDDEEDQVGTRWAVLVAGSNGYGNYRHQADVCHAYQILRRGGLKEENIVVFMYDDIANSTENPRPGVIINSPHGHDVYAGVPKDYTGDEVNTKNLYAVILGEKDAVEGGSGKVIDSKPNDRIFIYYSDHGGPGVLGMPNMPYLVASEFIHVLKKKHASKSYKEMVIYVEACESGSIFEGLLPPDLNIYVMTASNAEENSWGTYCPGMDPPAPHGYDTCLGDFESHNLKKETIGLQFEKVKNRTSAVNYSTGSHVMEYGTKNIKVEMLYLYQGFDPANANATENALPRYTHMEAVNQRDADLLHLWHRYKKLDDRSEAKEAVLREITETMVHRVHLDNSVEFIGKLLFGSEAGNSVLNAVRPLGQALVDDWDCFKKMVRVFESQCGSLTQYGMKHMRVFANICNRGVSVNEMEKTCKSVCSNYFPGRWSPVSRGYSA
ncbi:hypothetical protein QJS04_geneDACA012363 [Acorus gramineus]|uniref:Legumain prodomain domain-containing protein n=1 Tax=Acorus gramineus TaxID=55184 RepID=A0AAV9B8L6_ACOGR|nr:hypothetical protein QJS04_geneDACA012363 [Acorus gramineus]